MDDKNIDHAFDYHSSRLADTGGNTNTESEDIVSLQDSDDEREIDATDASILSEALAWIPCQPSSQKFPLLDRPVAIPQIQPNSFRSGPMPFCRAYAPALADNAVSCVDFIAFIDDLTIAQAPAAPFQALQLAGTGIGFVPHHWAQAASAGMGMAAGLGSAATSITRVKLYLKKVNERYFLPRGLKATIVDDEQLRAIVHADPVAEPLAPLNEAARALTLAERRIKALEQRISPLDFNVPAPNDQTNVLDRLAAKQVQATVKKSREKALKEARKQGLPQANAAAMPSRQANEVRSTDDPDASPALPFPPSQDHKQDVKIQALEFRMHEIGMKAARQMLSETKEKRKEKIEKEKVKDMAKVQEKIDERLNTLSITPGDGRPDGDRERGRHSSKKHKESKKKGEKHAGKEAEKAAKLKWIVIDNVKASHDVAISP